MGYFPFYMDIADKKCVVIGGGSVALRKIEKLLPFEADITVIAPEICEGILSLDVKTIKRAFDDNDIDGAFMVISATDNHGLNRYIYELCAAKNILINSVDDIESCGFIFPAIIKNGDITVGVATSGKAPAYARYLRKRIEKIVDDKAAEKVKAVSEYREKLKCELLSEEERRAAVKSYVENDI